MASGDIIRIGNNEKDYNLNRGILVTVPAATGVYNEVFSVNGSGFIDFVSICGYGVGISLIVDEQEIIRTSCSSGSGNAIGIVNPASLQFLGINPSESSTENSFLLPVRSAGGRNSWRAYSTYKIGSNASDLVFQLPFTRLSTNGDLLFMLGKSLDFKNSISIRLNVGTTTNQEVGILLFGGVK